MFDGDDPGCPSPRPLRGFRRRWTDAGSVAAASHVGSSEHDFDANANLPELPSPEMDLFGVPGGSDSVDGWALVHEGFAREGSDLYEPESPVNDAAVFQHGPDVTDPLGTESVWQHCALTAQSKRQRLDRTKMPWEQSPFSSIFGVADKWSGTAVSNLDDMFKPTLFGCVDVLQSRVVSEHADAAPSVVTSTPVVSINLRKVRREMPDEDLRRVALAKLRDIILQDPLATQLGTSVHNLMQAGCSHEVALQSIGDCFRMKASSTLQKRASSLWRLGRLRRAGGFLNLLRVTEEALYRALCDLRESGSGATTAQHMLEALHFLDATARLVLIDLRTVISGRCKGVAKDMFLMKNPLEQKYPLTMENVRFLEDLYHTLPNTMKCILGQLLFCVHSCCRWRDSQRVKWLCVEQGHGETLVHADALSSKTAVSAEARTRYLPYVALGSGVNGADWGADWVTARLVEGLEYQDFILPSFSERTSCWTDSPMSASEATYWLREFLGESLSPMDVFKYGSHSCKSTLLTWAGRCVKIQFSPMERRLLGHHLEPSMKSILTYSREAFTTVYSKVLQMFRLMRDGTYNPDLPAIDRVVQLSETVAEEPQTAGVDTSVADACDSDSESSVASDCGAAGEDCCEPGLGEDMGLTSLFPDFPGVPEAALMVHKVSKLVHAMNEDGYLVCGRRPSVNFIPYSRVTRDRDLCEGCRQCRNSFQQ